MDLRDLQKAEIDTLKHILSIIQENNLSYFILGGTLLGAVRHKGFIPWDEDIDIGMPRDDYEIFMQKAQAALPDYLQVRSFKRDRSYQRYFSRIENTNYKLYLNNFREKQEAYLWIDIFPLDGMPSGGIKKRLHMFNLMFRRLLLQYSFFPNGLSTKKNRPTHDKILIILGHVITKFITFDTQRCLYALDKLLKKYPYNSSEYIGNYMGVYRFREIFPKCYYANGSLYKFENIDLRGPVEYDKVLSQIYGDYMKFPPEHERSQHAVSF